MVFLSLLNLRKVGDFVAFDCANSTNWIDVYSLLQPAVCPSAAPYHQVERIIFGEIVQIKSDRRLPGFRYWVIETVTSQYCGFCQREELSGT